ncbi:MAG: porin family protein [Saprospiraceae bacterium]
MRRNPFSIIILFVFFFSQNTFAQISVGIKTGINFADANIDGIANNYLPNAEVYTGFSVGIVAEIPMLHGFSFRPELNYIEKGFQSMEDFGITQWDIQVGAGVKTRLQYIEAPLLMKFSQGNDLAKFYVIAGPNVSYAVDGWVRPVVRAVIDFTLPRNDLHLSNDIYRRWEISATGGIGGEVKAGGGKIFADVRYTQGFSNILDNPIVDIKIRNQGFGLNVGYAYNF